MAQAAGGVHSREIPDVVGIENLLQSLDILPHLVALNALATRHA